MKLLNIDWWQFLGSLESYRRLSPANRRMFIEQVKPAQPVSKKLLGPASEALVESGLMALGQTGVNAQVKPEHREFSRAMRAMSRARIFAAPSRDHFLNYINDNLTGSETAALQGAYYRGHMGYQELERLYSTVCSANWIRQFLAAKGPEWERDYADPAQPRYFGSPIVLEAAQRLVGAIGNEAEPVTPERLPGLCGEVSSEVFSAVMRGILRYLLLFTALRSEDLEPVIGLWPGVAERLLNRPVPAPDPVKVEEPFQSTFLMDDMTVILSACAAEPLRIRSGDMQIFEADHKGLVAALGSLPGWFEQSFHNEAEHRVIDAVVFLNLFRFVERAGKPGSTYRLAPTLRGSAWLVKPAKERLQFLFDGLRDMTETDHQIPMLPGVAPMGSLEQGRKLAAAVSSAYSGLPEGSFFRLGEFLNYQARSNNVLAALMSEDRRLSLLVGRTYVSSSNATSPDEAEAAWQNLLSGFFKFRLAPLGGLQLGVETSTNLICFALTSAGRYLCGASGEFELPPADEARILVQPNFDVVFMTPSARLESELARFSERKGRHIGTLFRITKGSVMAAAAGGMTAEQVLDTLRRHSPAELPANVTSEIGGWFRRFRQVTMRQAVVIHCPDEQTATTFMAAVGGNVTRLTETTLELHEAKIQPAVAKKLREAGIFVRSE